MTTINQLPIAPDPNNDDASTFSAKATAFTQALPSFVVQTNAVADEVNGYSMSAAAVAAAQLWTPGTSYNNGQAVVSLLSYLTYRRSALTAGNDLAATTTATGTSGASTITVASATGIVVNQYVTGTGISTNPPTRVTAVSGTTITLSNPLTTTITNSSVSFYTDPSLSANWTAVVGTGNVTTNTVQSITGTKTFTRILLGSGSAAAPALGFASDANQDTGFYFTGDGSWNFVSNGVLVMQFTGGANTIATAGAIATVNGVNILSGGAVRARGGAPGALGANNNGYGFSGNGGDTDGGLYSELDGQVTVYADNQPRMRFTSSNQFFSAIPGFGGTLYPDFACRAWVNFSGVNTAAIRAAGNVTSVSRNAVGDYTVNFSNIMPDANYMIAMSQVANSTNQAVTVSGVFGTETGGAQDKSTVSVRVINGRGNVAGLFDSGEMNVAIFR